MRDPWRNLSPRESLRHERPVDKRSAHRDATPTAAGREAAQPPPHAGNDPQPTTAVTSPIPLQPPAQNRRAPAGNASPLENPPTMNAAETVRQMGSPVV